MLKSKKVYVVMDNFNYDPKDDSGIDPTAIKQVFDSEVLAIKWCKNDLQDFLDEHGETETGIAVERENNIIRVFYDECPTRTSYYIIEMDMQITHGTYKME